MGSLWCLIFELGSGTGLTPYLIPRRLALLVFFIVAGVVFKLQALGNNQSGAVWLR